MAFNRERNDKVSRLLRELGVKPGSKVTMELMVLLDIIEERPASVYGGWYSDIMTTAAVRMAMAVGAISAGLTRLVQSIWEDEEAAAMAAKRLGLKEKPSPKAFVLTLAEAVK